MDFGTLADLIKLLEVDFAAYDAPGDALKTMKNLKYDNNVRGHPHYPIPITKPDDHGSALAPTSIPTHYIPPHRRVYSKNPIVT